MKLQDIYDEFTPHGRKRRHMDEEEDVAAEHYIDNTLSGPLARQYIRMCVSVDPNKRMDHTYGVRHKIVKGMVSDSLLETDERDDVYINGIRYMGTRGLYELLFTGKSNDKYTTKRYDDVQEDISRY